MATKDYKIRIDGIDIIGKELHKFQTSETDVFNHLIKAQVIGDDTKNLIVCFVEVIITRLNEPNIVLASIMIGIGFVIENFKEVIDKNEEGQNIIPAELENLLKSVSISTMRGIMFSEFRGTQLHRAVLPIILMDSLKPIPENLIDKIKKPASEVKIDS